MRANKLFCNNDSQWNVTNYISISILCICENVVCLNLMLFVVTLSKTWQNNNKYGILYIFYLERSIFKKIILPALIWEEEEEEIWQVFIFIACRSRAHIKHCSYNSTQFRLHFRNLTWMLKLRAYFYVNTYHVLPYNNPLFFYIGNCLLHYTVPIFFQFFQHNSFFEFFLEFKKCSPEMPF